MKHSNRSGFTIVELLIVIVVIAILAAITVAVFQGIQARAGDASLNSDLSSGSKQLEVYRAANDSYPTSNDCTNPNPAPPTICIKTSGGNSVTLYSANNSTLPKTYTLQITRGSRVGTITPTTSASLATVNGSSSGNSITNGSIMQTVTSANCPSTRTRTVDARDSHTYWIQKLADGKCWMLTNLAYAGGGTNTYSDTRALIDRTGGPTSATDPYYYIVPSTVNYTTEPNSPSTSTDGTGQYGYLYNFCSANGNQAGNGGCSGSTSTVNTLVSACPAGWRLPTGGAGGEFEALNAAVNEGSTTTDAGLRTTWLAQRSGGYYSAFVGQGNNAASGPTTQFWAHTQVSDFEAHVMATRIDGVNATTKYTKSSGFAVRCLAN